VFAHKLTHVISVAKSFSVVTTTALETSLIDRYGPILLGDNAVVPATSRFSRCAVVLHLHSAYLPSLRQASSSTWVNVKIIFTLASVCDLWGLNLFPIHSCELDTTIILCRVHLLSSSSATYIFGQVVVTTKHADPRSTCWCTASCV
jgi:hypothetical protein